MSSDRQPTLRDVAERAGVHVATASRAMNDEQTHLVSEATRSRVRAAAEALGYRPNAVAQSLRKGSTGVIGVVVADLSNSFIVPLLRGVEQEARARDVLPIVAETHDDPAILRTVVTRLLRNRVDAIIMCAVHATDEEFITELERRLPVVLAVRSFRSTAGESPNEHFEVLQDDVLGAKTAVNHLIDLGHRRIAQLPGNANISSFSDRSDGYRSAIAAHPEVSDVSTGARAIESTVAEGRRLAAELLRLPEDRRPTAIFAHNDQMAVGAIDALRDAGMSCPQDVSVVGYNDAPLSDHLDPPLTTVALPTFELGRHSARLAFSALDTRGVDPSRIMIAPKFIERKSARSL